jgi:hypothetical protein
MFQLRISVKESVSAGVRNGRPPRLGLLTIRLLIRRPSFQSGRYSVGLSFRRRTQLDSRNAAVGLCRDAAFMIERE